MSAIAALVIVSATLLHAAEPSQRVHQSSSQPGAHTDHSFDAAIATARARLQQLVDNGRTPGVSGAVVIDGHLVWSEGFGFANLEHKVPATRDTRFGLGSISKTLTMAGALVLFEDGLLDLDAPVERYLPDFPHAGKGITLRRIAAHQSGLSDEFANAHNETAQHFATIDAAYQQIKRDRLVYEPGTQVQYATGTYTILARVMEAVARRPYLEIMRGKVFDPLGLRSMVPNERHRIIAGRTDFYVKAASGEYELGPFFDPSYKLPGAGFLATAEDVARFGAGLLDGALLNDRARQEMFTPVPLRDGTPTEYALGLRLDRHGDRTLLHLPGGGIGISGWIYIYPKEKLVLALLSNVPTGPVGGATHEIIATAFLDAISDREQR